MKNRWGKLAGQLGIAYFLAGLVLVFLGWNGAATYDRVSAQVPYVISGGLAGLCLVVIGGSVLVAASAREGAAALEATVADLREAVDRMAAGGASSQGAGVAAGQRLDTAAAPAAGSTTAHGVDSSAGQGASRTTVVSSSTVTGTDAVVAGPTSYHRPGCRLVEGQAGVTPTTSSEAMARGLSACRVCAPDVPTRQDVPG